MKRGEIWSVSGPGYAGKPRPTAIVQDDRFSPTATITVCPLTSDETAAELFRLLITPSAENGLRLPSRLMVDKLSTIPRQNSGRQIGRLSARDLAALDRAIVLLLGLGADPNA